MSLLDADRSSPAGTPTRRRRRSSRGEDLSFLFFGLWALAGLCLDGWAHRHQPELETFFTPWHAVFYSGFLGGVACLAWIVMGGRAQAESLWAAVPDGYQLAVAGLAVFAVGGIGDGIWHTVFGVETDIDALLSPTHLIMLIGMLGSITAPLRAAGRDDAMPVTPTLSQFLAPLLSITVAATSVAFFFLYASGLNNWPMTDTLIVMNDDSQVRAALGVLSTIVTTVILLTPVMVLLQRWVPPAGSFTVLFTLVGLFMAGLDAFENWWQVLPAVAGGMVADGLIGSVFRRSDTQVTNDRVTGAARQAALWCGTVVPIAVWGVSTILIHRFWELRWPPELWAGAIVMATLSGLALALITHPARPARLERHR